MKAYSMDLRRRVLAVCRAVKKLGWSPTNKRFEPTSKIKAWLRRPAARTVKGLIQAVGETLRAVHANECHAYPKKLRARHT